MQKISFRHLVLAGISLAWLPAIAGAQTLLMVNQGDVNVSLVDPVAGNVQRIAISADDKLVFTADQTKPQMAVIDTARNKVKSWVALPGLGYGAAATADGKWLLVAVPSKDLVAVVDLASMQVVPSVAIGTRPQEILIRPDGKVAYVSCPRSGQVAAVDLAAWKVEKLIGVGKGADGLGWAK